MSMDIQSLEECILWSMCHGPVILLTALQGLSCTHQHTFTLIKSIKYSSCWKQCFSPCTWFLKSIFELVLKIA